MIPNSAADRKVGRLHAWRQGALVVELIVTIIGLAAALILFSRFLPFVESRPGITIGDILLYLIPPENVTVPIFTLVYGAVALGLVSLAPHPGELLLTLRAYTLVVLIRIVTLYLLPLAPPHGMILLIDPIYSLGPGLTVTKDLFFSGHTAMMVLLSLTARERWLRRTFAIGAVVMAILLLIQHCHYAIDILAAPFFTYGCVRMARGGRTGGTAAEGNTKGGAA
jgi:hypothetical protein